MVRGPEQGLLLRIYPYCDFERIEFLFLAVLADPARHESNSLQRFGKFGRLISG